MAERRRFNLHERTALYLAADGYCENCGKPLTLGWHADHVQPWSKSGPTNVTNGQALCPECNLKKGSKMPPIILRECQKQFKDRLKEAAHRGQHVFIANLAPGAGKSLSGLCGADELMREGLIDTLVWCVPRKNLGNQVEIEWLKRRDVLPWPRTMKDIDFRSNNPPLIRGGASGYITTYASLVAQPSIHIQAFKGRRVMLFLDEAQQLGVAPEYAGLDGKDVTLPPEAFATASAKVCQELGTRSVIIVLATGTAERADGQQLLFAERHYSAPDEEGWCKLNADVELTYRDGVAQRFLRPYQANLYEGQIDWHELGGETTTYRTTEMDRNVYRALQDEDYAHALIDSFVEIVRDQQATVHPRMAGLLVGYKVKDVRSFEAYLKRRHRNMRVVVAASDDVREAKTELDRFREDAGYADILVTVNMAYIGYDCNRISTLGLLTAYRTNSYLDQVSARAMRMMPDLDADLQWCHVVAPDDPAMRAWSQLKREESEAGMKIRPVRERGPQPPPPTPKPGYADNGEIISTSALGYYEQGDIQGTDEYQLYDEMRKRFRVAGSNTQLKAVVLYLQEQGVRQAEVATPVVPPAAPATSTKTKKELENELRQTIDRMCKFCDGQWHSPIEQPDWGSTATELARVYDWEKVAQADLAGLEARKKTLDRWIRLGYSDGKR